MSVLPKPVYEQKLFCGKATMIVFGAPFDWNYAGANREEMEAKNPGISLALEEVMHTYDIRRALVPKPAFNAKVATANDLKIELLPGFFRGMDADGVLLTEPGDAYFLASADCLTTALFDVRMNAVAALHCGRDALIDRKFIDHMPKRDHTSVIDAGVRHLDELFQFAHLSSRDVCENNEFGWLQGGDEENMERLYNHTGMVAYLAAGIRPDTFEHPTVNHPYAEANARMVKWLELFEARSNILHTYHGRSTNSHPRVVTDSASGKIDLFALVRRQLWACRVDRLEEDAFDTATSTGPDGEFLFHSNRRDKLKRNLVVVRLN